MMHQNMIESSEARDGRGDSNRGYRVGTGNQKSGGSAAHYRFHMTPQPETLAQWEERTSLACENIS